ncbi:hypothetical protein [Rhodococcus sp. 14-2470-1a]|uniref:hypothetical protein n=2 Tax=unclassified Rhodococcus (in: high G+C Gram-positive bacteria) TaxID=192944 RepID=UPI00211AF1BE|nr:MULTISPECIES: hypothetical protein [unclassified Rhodococcus (in: high G+C Gram-positive bacteria)]
MNWQPERGTPSSDSTVQPFVYKRKPRTKMIVSSAVGLSAAALLVYGALSISSGDGRDAAQFALTAALCLVLGTTSPWFNQNSSKVGPAVLHRVHGSTIRYERWGLFWRSALIGAFALLMWLSLWFLTPLFLTFYGALAWRSVRNGWVELDADGVRHRGWSFDMRASWDSLHTVRIEDRISMTSQGWVTITHQCVSLKPDIVLSGYKRDTAWFWRIEKRPIITMDLDCRRFDVHPVVLQAWIAFYLQNPKMRFELGTDAAAQRLASITP